MVMSFLPASRRAKQTAAAAAEAPVEVEAVEDVPVEKLELSSLSEAEQAAVKEINSGCYWFDTADLLDVLFELTPNNAQGEYYLTDCLGLLIGKGKRANAFISANPNVSLGANDPAGLAYLNELAAQMK